MKKEIPIAELMDVEVFFFLFTEPLEPFIITLSYNHLPAELLF